MRKLLEVTLCGGSTVLFFTQAGRGVHLGGLGTYLPHIKLDGNIKVSHRLDPFIKNYLNVPGEFTGEILNSQNIGLTPAELIAIWDEGHPDDPIPHRKRTPLNRCIHTPATPPPARLAGFSCAW